MNNMQILFNIFIFIFGLIIGSFLNCLMYRIEKEEKLSGRSYCPHCKHTLTWKDLFPVVSFLFLRGKCRYCTNKIALQYPIVEMVTGVLFVLLLYQFKVFAFSNILNLLFLFYIVSSLLVIFIYDVKHYLIPDTVLFPAIIITFLYQLVLQYTFLIFNSLFAAIMAFLFFGFIFLISKGEWMGFGDCKLVILLGLLLGFPNILLALLLSFFFGAIIGLGLMIFDKKGLKSQIPFAPFLISGTVVAMLFGYNIIHWYLNFFI